MPFFLFLFGAKYFIQFIYCVIIDEFLLILEDNKFDFFFNAVL